MTGLNPMLKCPIGWHILCKHPSAQSNLEEIAPLRGGLHIAHLSTSSAALSSRRGVTIFKRCKAKSRDVKQSGLAVHAPPVSAANGKKTQRNSSAACKILLCWECKLPAWVQQQLLCVYSHSGCGLFHYYLAAMNFTNWSLTNY